jgi:hypothetical protein
MKKIILILFIVFISACKQNEVPLKNDKPSYRSFGRGIIEGKIHPTDNEETFACLDSIDDDQYETRQFYFEVYRAICRKSDGALGEAIPSYTQSYFIKYPDEALIHFHAFDKIEKDIFIDNLAFEFYVSGMEGNEEIEPYFNEVQNNRKTSSNNDIFIQIKSMVEKRFTEMQD